MASAYSYERLRRVMMPVPRAARPANAPAIALTSEASPVAARPALPMASVAPLVLVVAAALVVFAVWGFASGFVSVAGVSGDAITADLATEGSLMSLIVASPVPMV